MTWQGVYPNPGQDTVPWQMYTFTPDRMPHHGRVYTLTLGKALRYGKGHAIILGDPAYIRKAVLLIIKKAVSPFGGFCPTEPVSLQKKTSFHRLYTILPVLKRINLDFLLLFYEKMTTDLRIIKNGQKLLHLKKNVVFYNHST